MSRNAVVFFLTFACFVILPSQAFSSQNLKVGIYQNPPKLFIDSTGAAQGFIIDILTDIARKNHWELTFIPGTWEECLNRLESGEIDLLPDIAWSEAREKTIDLNHEVIFVNWAQIYTRVLSEINGIVDLEGKIIAVLKDDYSYNFLVGRLKDFGVAVEYLEKDSFGQVMAAVENKEADAGLVSRLFGESNEQLYNLRQSPIVIAPAKIHFAAPKGKNALVLSEIDKSLLLMKTDLNSVYYQAMNKWLSFLYPKYKTPMWHYLLGAGLFLLILLGGIFILSLRAGIRLKTRQLRNANDELTQNGALLREMEKVARIGGWEYDVEKKTNLWTREVYHLHGVSPEEYDSNDIERDISFYEEGKSRAAIESAFGKAVENGEPFDLELKIRNAQGELLWVRAMGKPMMEGKRVVKVRGAFQDITLRKTNETDLNLYYTAIQQATDIIFIADVNGVIKFVNHAFTEVTGYNPEDAIGKTASILKSGLTENRTYKELWENILAGNVFKNTPINKKKNGELFHYDQSITPIKDADGNISHFISTGSDITELKLAEEQSRRNNQVISAINKMFQETFTCDTLEEVAFTCITLAEQLTGSEFGFIGEINQNGRFDTLSYGNLGWAICKLPESEAISLSINMPVRGIWGEVIRQNKSQITNDPSAHPKSVGTPEGHPPLTSFLGVPLNHQGKTIGMIGLANKESGYTEEDQRTIEMLSTAFVVALNRMKTWQALQKSEERYKSLIDGLDDGVLILDGLKIVMINSKLKEIFKLDFELEGKDISVLAKELGIPFEGEIAAHFERLQRKEPRSYYKLMVKMNGNSVNLSIREELITFEGRQVIRSIIRDESELSQVEEQFRQSQKLEAVGMLVGGITHDYNNLLTIIGGNVELAKMDLPDEESPMNHYLSQIKNASSRASALTKQLLAFSRKQTLMPKVCDINEIIKDTKKMLPRLVGEHIMVKTELAENLHNAYVDRGNIDQVLINLAVNARDAMPNGGRISISTRNSFIDEKWGAFTEKLIPGEYVELAFSDTGDGIPAEVQDKIFDPFFTTKGVGKGTGLGLSTIFGIIKQHNGYIKCYSEEGIGTTFKIYLPRHEGEIEESAITLLEGEMPRGSESILVVEDSEEIRALTVAVLSRLGYQVFKAGDGGEAYSFCEMVTKPVDLVLTDVIMPAMNGIEFEEHVRNIWPMTKVLFMTGYTADVVKEYLRPNKKYIFLHKPFIPLELAQKVREVLDSVLV